MRKMVQRVSWDGSSYMSKFSKLCNCCAPIRISRTMFKVYLCTLFWQCRIIMSSSFCSKIKWSIKMGKLLKLVYNRFWLPCSGGTMISLTKFSPFIRINSPSLMMRLMNNFCKIFNPFYKGCIISLSVQDKCWKTL